MKIRSTISILLLVICQSGWAQPFTNLNFESVNASLTSPGQILPINVLPGWAFSLVPIYDGISFGGAMISLQDSNTTGGSVGFSVLPLQGNYSVLLQGSTLAAATTASIGQTGTIPNTAQSLTFFAEMGGTVQVSFSGQALSFVAISNTLNYTVYGADISPFAGQTGQLLFTVPVQNSALLDNIQFSSVPIPEPSVVALGVLGACVLGFHFRRNRPG